jgi:hypothetical protein
MVLLTFSILIQLLSSGAVGANMLNTIALIGGNY